MRSSYFAHYPPTQDEFDRLWTSGLIVVDTNALLSLYRYTPDTRDDFLGTLRSLADRLWMPHHVGLEFNRNRIDRILGQRKAYGDVFAALESAENVLLGTLRGHEEHSSMPATKSIQILSSALSTVTSLLAEAQKNHDADASPLSEVDFIWNEVSDIYEGKVGTPYTEEELAAIYKTGKERYEAKVPPGYRDISKPDDRRYGDLVIWMELLRRAGEIPSDVIFITEDVKEDWWLRVHGKTIGPRVELVEEFARKTNGKRVHFYETLRFLEFAKERGLSSVRDTSLGEVRRISETRDRMARLIGERDSLRAQLNAMSAKYNGREMEMQVELDRLNMRARRLEQEYESATADLLHVEEVSNALQDDVLTTDDERSSVLRDVERARQDVDDKSDELAAIRHDIDRLRYQIKRLRGSSVDERRMRQVLTMLNHVENQIAESEAGR